MSDESVRGESVRERAERCAGYGGQEIALVAADVLWLLAERDRLAEHLKEIEEWLADRPRVLWKPDGEA